VPRYLCSWCSSGQDVSARLRTRTGFQHQDPSTCGIFKESRCITVEKLDSHLHGVQREVQTAFSAAVGRLEQMKFHSRYSTIMPMIPKKQYYDYLNSNALIFSASTGLPGHNLPPTQCHAQNAAAKNNGQRLSGFRSFLTQIARMTLRVGALSNKKKMEFSQRTHEQESLDDSKSRWRRPY
jgi:hypothetical protein